MESTRTENTIVICDYCETGLLKNGEPVTIESIAVADEKLKNEFNTWLIEAGELLQPFEFTVEMLKLYRPKLADIKYHNRDGFELAKRIQSIVGNNVKVYYSCIDIGILLVQAKNT